MACFTLPPVAGRLRRKETGVNFISAEAWFIGASRSQMTEEQYQDFARNAIKAHVKPDEIDEAEVETFVKRFSYTVIDAKSDEGWDTLKNLIGRKPARIRAFYLAVAPSLFGEIASRLKAHGLITRETRIIVEKPIGRDLQSAKILNDTLGSVFHEDQIFRIDHYLGKETVQNLLALRFANILFEPLWNAQHIDHVQITVAETVGLDSLRSICPSIAFDTPVSSASFDRLHPRVWRRVFSVDARC